MHHRYRLNPRVLDSVASRIGVTSDEGLAEALGCDLPTVQRWRAGACCPDIAGAARLARLSGWNMGDLLEEVALHISPDSSFNLS